ncbi:MAG: hypothetical protein JWM76_2652 [Pseudonocardiales bacterium]|nr:hypothetical protein [Pseudonocardiales bacterium]
MKFRLSPPGMSLYPGTANHWWERITTDDIVRIAQTADQLGFDYISVDTHLGMAEPEVGEMGARWLDSVSAAGFLLGATTKITAVPLIIVPLHNPVMLAQSLATLDYLSGGRVIPLALLGYKPGEFELAGVPFEERAARMDEHLDVMRQLWTSRTSSFQGKFTQFTDLVFDPRPSCRLPIWIGGRTKAAVRRIARVGDGWISYATPRAEFAGMVAHLKEQPAYVADPRELELQMYLFEGRRDPVSHVVIEQPKMSLAKDFILEQVQALANLGVTIVDASSATGTGVFQNDQPGSPPPTTSLEDYLERLHWFAETIMPSARAIQPSS